MAFTKTATKDTSLAENVRSQWRIPRALHKLLLAIGVQKNISLNEIINNAVLDYIKRLALAHELDTIEGYDVAPTAVAVGLLAKVENSADSVREMRELGESGEIPTFEQFDFLRRNISPMLRDALAKDISLHGPLIYRSSDDPLRKPSKRSQTTQATEPTEFAVVATDESLVHKAISPQNENAKVETPETASIASKQADMLDDEPSDPSTIMMRDLKEIEKIK